jgi:hypothetical protein
MTPLPTRDELVQALAAVDGNQRSRPLILDRLYGPLADGVLELLRQDPPQVAGEDVTRVALAIREALADVGLTDHALRRAALAALSARPSEQP